MIGASIFKSEKRFIKNHEFGLQPLEVGRYVNGMWDFRTEPKCCPNGEQVELGHHCAPGICRCWNSPEIIENGS